MSEEDDRSVVDLALDAFVYAPLGLLLEARDLMPKMAQRGRGQVALTRLAGKVAAQRGRAAMSADDPPKPDADATGDDRPVVDLPIDGYDDLSAPQLLPRLETLDSEGLESVLAHEENHRARATVINRIKQLRD